MESIVINLFGGPCTGKSTLAAELFVCLRKKGVSCEMVPEYAKELVYENRYFRYDNRLENNLAVMAETSLRINRLVGKVDYIIVDAPIHSSIMHCKEEDMVRVRHCAEDLTKNENSINFLLPPIVRYEDYGRTSGEDRAQEKQELIEYYLEGSQIKHTVLYNENRLKTVLREIGE